MMPVSDAWGSWQGVGGRPLSPLQTPCALLVMRTRKLCLCRGGPHPWWEGQGMRLLLSLSSSWET